MDLINQLYVNVINYRGEACHVICINKKTLVNFCPRYLVLWYLYVSLFYYCYFNIWPGSGMHTSWIQRKSFSFHINLVCPARQMGGVSVRTVNFKYRTPTSSYAKM